LKRELSREKVLETIGVLALACLVAGHLAQRPGLKTGFLGAAALLLATGLFVKPAGLLIARVWLGFGGLLGAVNSRIVLAAIFYLVLTPVATLARLTRGDFLQLKKAGGADRSYWHARNRVSSAADLEKLW
jgi:hypothetical protein